MNEEKNKTKNYYSMKKKTANMSTNYRKKNHYFTNIKKLIIQRRLKIKKSYFKENLCDHDLIPKRPTQFRYPSRKFENWFSYFWYSVSDKTMNTDNWPHQLGNKFT